jgi:hypothetical protein
MLRWTGERSRFALGHLLLADPDEGPWLRRKSWGRLQSWVAGHNLTLGHSPDGGSVDAAEVPLLPVVEWLAREWDPLLHEERLPRPSRALSAASWRIEALARLPPSAAELDALLDEREAYWQRHGLGSALSGFRVPDLHVRRCGEDVELSWDDREWRTVPSGMRLAERPGHARLPAKEVAAVLMGFAEDVLDRLAEVAGEVAEATAQLADLRARLRAHAEGDRDVERLRWFAGVNIDAAARARPLAGENIALRLGRCDHHGRP